MTQRVELSMLDSTGATEIAGLVFDDATLGVASTTSTVKIKNIGTVDALSVDLYAIRADFLLAARVGEDSEDGAAMGQECIAESWMEAKLLPGDPWTPLDVQTNYLALGALAAGASVTVYLRFNPAATATTLGRLDFALVLRSTTA